jgi:hypothetical protein
MKMGGVSPVFSFFPLGMQGISEVVTEVSPMEYDFRKISPLRVFFRRKGGNKIFESIKKNIVTVAKSRGVVVEEVDFDFEHFVHHMDPDYEKYKADLGIVLTGILVSNPLADIRFMFLSKEGIRLPDENGKIKKEISKNDFSPQRVNELLWEQGVVFPIGHFSYGLWSRPDLNADFSLLNTIEPPTDFQWIGFAR